jgi:hypothetical protein
MTKFEEAQLRLLNIIARLLQRRFLEVEKAHDSAPTQRGSIFVFGFKKAKITKIIALIIRIALLISWEKRESFVKLI